jgi:two-component system sensor histidine kinase RpfC
MVSDGEQALEALTEQDAGFDAVILDMNMPGIAGLDVVRRYRFIDTSGAVPVIILTADATLETKQACKEAGADTYLTKPVDANLLLEAVARHSRQQPVQDEKNGTVIQIQANGETGDITEKLIDRIVLDELRALSADPVFLAGLIEKFDRDGSKHIRHLHAARAKPDYPRFHDGLHSLKGSAGTLGCVRVARLCADAERLRPHELTSMKTVRLISRIEQAFKQSCAELKAYLEALKELT